MNTTVSKYEDCIDQCIACAVECRHCIGACLHEEDIKVLTHCIKLNDDCAAICLLAMNAMVSSSEFTDDICKLCANICTACAIECEKHSHMQHCARCAAQCRKCAAACTSMYQA
jgi:hypothetical protein